MEHDLDLVRSAAFAVALHSDDILSAYAVPTRGGRSTQPLDRATGKFDVADFCVRVGSEAPVHFDLLGVSAEPSGFVITFTDLAQADEVERACPPSLALAGTDNGEDVQFVQLIYLVPPTNGARVVLRKLRDDNCAAIAVHFHFEMPATAGSKVVFCGDGQTRILQGRRLRTYSLDQFESLVVPMINRMRAALQTHIPLANDIWNLSNTVEAKTASTVDQFTKSTPGHAGAETPPAITKKELDLYRMISDDAPDKKAKARGAIYSKAKAIAAALPKDASDEVIDRLLNDTLVLKEIEAAAVDKIIASKVGVPAGKIEKLRSRLRKNAREKSDERSGLNSEGWIQFGDDSEFYIADYEGQPWIWRRGSKENGDRRVCQRFRVTRVATNIGGKAQHLTIAFPTPEGDMSVTFPRGDLQHYAKVGEALLDAGFMSADTVTVCGILMPLAFAANALVIDRTGFAYSGNAFLRPDGRTVRHDARVLPAEERPYLQTPGADRPAHLFTKGTPEGYIAATRPAFVGRDGKTWKPVGDTFNPGPFPNVALMAAGAAAGVVHTFANPL